MRSSDIRPSAPAGGRRDLVVDRQAAARRGHADDRGALGPSPGPTISSTWFSLYCSALDRRAIAEREVVPRPAEAPAGLGERVVIADQMPPDDAHAPGRQLPAPSRRTRAQRSG